MSDITITISKELAKQFIKVSDDCYQRLINSGCSDLVMEDTPENRELIESSEAHNMNMTLEEYRASDEYSEPLENNGNLYYYDFVIFSLFMEKIKDSIDE